MLDHWTGGVLLIFSASLIIYHTAKALLEKP